MVLQVISTHFVAYPDVDWIMFADRFVSNRLNLQRYRYTTQIEHYDNLSAAFDGLKRINVILLDLVKTYGPISLWIISDKGQSKRGWLICHATQVNPIDFENAEGNLGIANALFEHMSSKLPVSRLQRDLTDSTVLRNIGVPWPIRPSLSEAY